MSRAAMWSVDLKSKGKRQQNMTNQPIPFTCSTVSSYAEVGVIQCTYYGAVILRKYILLYYVLYIMHIIQYLYTYWHIAWCYLQPYE